MVVQQTFSRAFLDGSRLKPSLPLYRWTTVGRGPSLAFQPTPFLHIVLRGTQLGHLIIDRYNLTNLHQVVVLRIQRTASRRLL